MQLSSFFSHILLITPALFFPIAVNAQLDESEMQQHLSTGAPLLGSFQPSDDYLANWMRDLDDATTLESLSMPGTHDSLTWAEDGLLGSFIKTQDISLFEQLDRGVRFIDLRVGQDGRNIYMFHGSTQLDDNTQLVDIFWGLYHWLDNHPTETVVVLLKVDDGDTTAELQQAVRDLVTGEGVADYWVQSNMIPTIGEARRKLVLFRRIDFDGIENVPPIGVDLSKTWADNHENFAIDYLGTSRKYVWVEDLYDVDKTLSADGIDVKFEAFTAHVEQAFDPKLDAQFFIHYASGFSTFITPEDLALGDGPSEPGMNQKAMEYLAGRQGQRVGVVVYDFYGSDARLGPVTLGKGEGLVDVSPTTTNTGKTSRSTNSSAISHISLSRAVLACSVIFTFALSFA